MLYLNYWISQRTRYALPWASSMKFHGYLAAWIKYLNLSFYQVKESWLYISSTTKSVRILEILSKQPNLISELRSLYSNKCNSVLKQNTLVSLILLMDINLCIRDCHVWYVVTSNYKEILGKYCCQYSLVAASEQLLSEGAGGMAT